MSITDAIKFVAATAVEGAVRLNDAINKDTNGPEPHPDVVDIIPPPHPRWVSGWWSDAVKRQAHPMRIGGPISPFAVVVHTTDMLEDEFDALVSATCTREGAHNAFHFLIGRHAAQGVVQVAPIDKNANHAGGPSHGVLVTPKGREYHPNLVTIGIELHCAGGVRKVEGKWRLVEDGKAHGRPIPDDDVIQDPQRPTRGWHRVTDYQYGRLRMLLNDLEPVMTPMPYGTVAKSTSQTPEEWALPRDGRVVGHCSLDFARRSDPWQPTMEWLRTR
jgi:hypothetical protein